MDGLAEFVHRRTRHRLFLAGGGAVTAPPGKDILDLGDRGQRLRIKPEDRGNRLVWGVLDLALDLSATRRMVVHQVGDFGQRQRARPVDAQPRREPGCQVGLQVDRRLRIVPPLPVPGVVQRRPLVLDLQRGRDDIGGVGQATGCRGGPGAGGADHPLFAAQRLNDGRKLDLHPSEPLGVRKAVGGDLPQQLAERIALAAFLALNRPVDLAQKVGVPLQHLQNRVLDAGPGRHFSLDGLHPSLYFVLTCPILAHAEHSTPSPRTA